MALFTGGTKDPPGEVTTKLYRTHELGPKSISQHQRGGEMLIEKAGHIYMLWEDEVNN